MLVKTIPLASIVQRSRDLRALNPDHVKRLAESIKEIGLQTPISVLVIPNEELRDTGTYILVAGLHRMCACADLNWTEIPAVLLDVDDVDRMLWEIDENLIRAELTELERAEHLAERKRLYERKYQWTKHGGAPGNKKPGGKGGKASGSKNPKLGSLPQPAFINDTADKTGISRTDIARSVHRAQAIASEVKDAIRDMPEIADKGVELDALAALETEDQKAAVEAVKSGKARNVREATKGAKTRKRKRQPRPAPSEEEKLRREITAAVERYENGAERRVSAITITHNPDGILVAIAWDPEVANVASPSD